ncbi:MAG: glycoside hydrolase family 25 protein [Oscillospiraceae bacterium]|nr:glycoside hydrolase family 25 protein [Oscillospiraceae bacterium]
MGIMEVLEELNDPELDETEQAPAQVEETAPAEPEESPVLEEAEAVPGEAGPEPEERTAALPRRKPIRPELIMGIIAAAAAVLLMVTIVLSIPYFGGEDEDPEALADRHSAARATEAVQETILEPTVSETEPENPTIPPDPNPYDRYDFQYNRKNYLLLQNLPSSAGVDVSAYQGDIDWKAVKNSGIEFAIIRLGYRGYESGKLVEDTYAKKNLEGAREAGLKVGAYFFSQALTVKEVDEEIKFMLGILGETYLDMPIVLDWEIPASSARTANMDARTLTDLQLHFCGQMKEKGYQPMVYFNWHQSENLYYLSELEDYPFWLALYQDRMTYPWKVEMWQWTCTGKVPGISGDVDINVYMPY